jgi:tripartite-type tricarboxylate transporter receptor subunit TctC
MLSSSPHNTSDDVVKRLNQEITTILQREDIKAKLNAFYFSSEPSTPQSADGQNHCRQSPLG